MRESTLTTLRCVPRFGYDFTEVRTIDIDLPFDAGEEQIVRRLNRWFADRGMEEAVYDVAADDNGFFAIINDEAYYQPWGEPLL